MKEAMFYEKLDEKKVRCFLCAHHCQIKDGKRGICYVRKNMDGILYSLVYGKVISMHIDPIEKKPTFPFPSCFHVFFDCDSRLQFPL